MKTQEPIYPKYRDDENLLALFLRSDHFDADDWGQQLIRLLVLRPVTPCYFTADWRLLIPAFYSGTDFGFWCRFCRKWNTHGLAGYDPRAGEIQHRGSHCDLNDECPLHPQRLADAGYYIFPAFTLARSFQWQYGPSEEKLLMLKIMANDIVGPKKTLPF